MFIDIPTRIIIIMMLIRAASIITAADLERQTAKVILWKWTFFHILYL